MKISQRFNKTLKEKGIKYLFGLLIRNVLNKTYLNYIYYKLFCSKRSFNMSGKRYKYFYSNYNYTWENERSVEIAIILDVLKKNNGKKILEVGNVLNNYTKLN